MIVDFPCRHSASVSVAPVHEPHQQAISSTVDVDRRVRFAATSLLSVTAPVSAEDLQAMWYSKEERGHQKETLKGAVRRLIRRLSTTSIASIHQEELYECIGMEAFLSRDVIVQRKRHRISHCRAILAAQARQRTSNGRDEEELARLSHKSSAHSCARARNIAAGYWKVLK